MQIYKFKSSGLYQDEYTNNNVYKKLKIFETSIFYIDDIAD